MTQEDVTENKDQQLDDEETRARLSAQKHRMAENDPRTKRDEQTRGDADPRMARPQ